MNKTLLLISNRIFLLLMLVLGTAVTAMAYEFKVNGICYDYKDNTSDEVIVVGAVNLYILSIPETVSYAGENYRVTAISNSAFKNCRGLAEVTISNSITSIGSYAFYGCKDLYSITIPNSITSIGSSAFYRCFSLEIVNISDIEAWCNIDFNNATSNPLCYAHHLYQNDVEITDLVIPAPVEVIKDYAFYGCSALNSLTLGNTVTTVNSSAFQGCTGLNSIKVLSRNATFDSRDNCNAIIETASNTLIYGCKSSTIPNSVTNISSTAFSGCTGLTSITIPNSITTINDSTFINCTGLTSVTIPNSVISIGKHAFDYCTGLTKVDISSIEAWCNIDFYDKTSNPLYYAHHLYLNGNEIKDLVIPNSVTNISKYAFNSCTGLTSITIPNSVTSIKYNAFEGCTGLTSVTIPNSITSIGSNAFKGCTGLTNVDISSIEAWCNINFSDSTSNPLCFAHHLYLNGNEIKDLAIPNTIKNIGSYTFYGCEGLTSVTIPNSVTTIGDYAFCNCTNLEDISIPDGIEIGKGAFDGTQWCANQPEGVLYAGTIAIGYKGTRPSELVLKEGTTAIANSAFSNFSTLTSVTLPNTLKVIGNEAFKYCQNLKTVDFGNSVTTIGDEAFNNCKWLSGVTLPNSVTTIGNYAFSNCYQYYTTTDTNSRNIYLGNSLKTIGDNAFYKCGFTSLTIPNSVTFIGDYAFSNCSFTSLTIPNSVTFIGEWAFADNQALAEVTMGNFVQTIGRWAFSGCTGLTRVNISSLETWCNINFYNDTSNPLYYAHHLYLNGSEIKDLVIPNTVKAIGSHTFTGCTVLTSVTIPNSITSIGYNPFEGCTGLTKVNISSIKAWCNINFSDSTSNPLYYAHHLYLNGNEIKDLVIPNTVNTIGAYSFWGCTELTSVTIPSTVTSIGYNAFHNCSRLSRVNITSMDAWFYLNFDGGTDSNPLYYAHHLYLNGTEVKELVIPNTITAIRDYAFTGCDLTNVTFPNTLTTIGNYAFYNCQNLNNLFLPNSVNYIGYEAFKGTKWYDSQADGVLYAGLVAIGYKGTMPSGTHLILKNGTKGIAGAAFLDCTGLTSIYIPNSVTTIGGWAFSGCTGLTSINIPNSVTNIGTAAFQLCTGLTSVTIPNSVTAIGYAAFDGCTGLTSVTIPNSITAIGYAAFFGCTGLTSVTIPNSVTTIGRLAFYGCAGLTSVTIPNSVTTIGDGAFWNCKNLTDIDIPNSVTAIGLYAFGGTQWLQRVANQQPHDVVYVGQVALGYLLYRNTDETTITLKNGTKGIAGGAFEGFAGLTNVTIPNSVTNIGYGAFEYCSGLTSISIPSSVTSIGYGAFEYCSGLNEVRSYIKHPEDLEEDIAENVFVGLPHSCVLYVPQGTKTTYEGLWPWAYFDHIIEMVPGDVNCDNEVNISDINAAINVILDGSGDSLADVNEDNEVNIADINALIDLILNQ